MSSPTAGRWMCPQFSKASLASHASRLLILDSFTVSTLQRLPAAHTPKTSYSLLRSSSAQSINETLSGLKPRWSDSFRVCFS